MEDREELRHHYRALRQAFLDAIDGLDDRALTERTIDGWSVADHLAHLAFWDDIRAGEIERISAGYDSAWRMDGAQDGILNDLAHTLRRDFSLTQARWEFDSAGRRLDNALAAATARGLDSTLYGEAVLRSTHLAAHTAWIARWRRERAV